MERRQHRIFLLYIYIFYNMEFGARYLHGGRECRRGAWVPTKGKVILPDHREWRRPWKGVQEWFLHRRPHIPPWTWWPLISTHIPNMRAVESFGSFPMDPLSFPPAESEKSITHKSKHNPLQPSNVQTENHKDELWEEPNWGFSGNQSFCCHLVAQMSSGASW